MAERPARVAALTGATGFFGRHIAEGLLRRGWRVRALVRPGRSLAQAIEPVAGDLDDADALRRLVAGAEAVVHVAGLTQARRAAEFHAVNAGGTRRLFEIASATAPGAHVVHVSSLAAREPALSPYAASKHASEEEAARLVPPERLAVVRPTVLYGPHDRQTLLAFRAVRLPLCLVPGSGAERISLCHVADAAGAVADILETGASGRFALADACPGGYTMREILRQAALAQGRDPRFLPVPTALFGAFALLSVAAAEAARRPALLTPGKVREMRHEDWSVDPADMPPGLAAKARSIEQGFRETVAWYRQAGWL